MFVARPSSALLLDRLFSAVASLVLAFACCSATWAQSPPEQTQPPPPSSSTQTADQTQPAKPPIAVNPKPCEITVTPAGAMTNTCAQEQQPAGVPPNGGTSPSGTTQVPGTGVEVQNQPPPTQPAPHPITKEEAKELFRSVDDILQFVSQDTGLPLKHKVHRKLITRQMMEGYINKRMKEDKDAQRLEREELVLQKFGLLPHDYDLNRQFLRLMGEQVAAYYEPKNKSVNLLDWVQPDIQKPVLAHELTHALQDQKVNLETWPDAGAKDNETLPDPQEEIVEEEQAARQCVTEGQAMVELFNYSLAPLGKDILTAPEQVNAMRAGMGDSTDSPEFAKAPMFLKEALMLPYTFGMDFVRTVLANQGREAAFAGLLENPPTDTRQVMEPETYLLHQVVTPPAPPDLDKLAGPSYERYDFGAMGEFDVYLLAKQYGGEAAPKKIYPHWRGGYYFAAHEKSQAKDRVSILYFSRWDTPEAARAFAKLYGDYTPKRYKKADAVTPSCPASDLKHPCPLQQWDTNEGRVRIETQGTDVLIVENFDAQTVERAREVLFSNRKVPEPAPQVRTAQVH